MKRKHSACQLWICLMSMSQMGNRAGSASMAGIANEGKHSVELLHRHSDDGSECIHFILNES